MRSSLYFVGILLVVLGSGCKSTQRVVDAQRTVTSATQTVEAGCGMCIFKMKDVFDCLLAVKIDGKPYLVTGSDIDDHGDAHAANGLCHVARQAQATGVVEGDRFVVTEFRLKP